MAEITEHSLDIQKLHTLVTSELPEDADVIVWLQGNEFDRGTKVLELYHAGHASKIFVTGNNTRQVDVGTVTVQAIVRWLKHRGIPDAAIVVDDASESTRDQSETVIRVAKQSGWSKMLLVGSTHHQLRSFLMFLHQARVQGWEGRIINQPVSIDWNTRPSGRTKTTGEAFAEEVEKIQTYTHSIASLEEGIAYFSAPPVGTVLAVLQVRVSSSRLPEKVLKPILGRPMLAHQLDRVRRSKKIDTLVVATSTNPEDDAIAELCAREGVACFRGSLDDVLDRFYRAATGHAPEHVVRLTGDCPLTDPGVIDETIAFFQEGDYDYVSNCQPPYTFPDGLDVEVMRFSALSSAWQEAILPSEREHVVPFIKRRPERFRLGHYTHKPSLGYLRWTVDEPEDFEFVTKIYEALQPEGLDFSSADVLRVLAEHPEWLDINRHHQRNAGSRPSLEADQKLLSKSAQPPASMFSFNGKTIGEGQPTYIISEIGVNHNGNFDQALWMIDESARAGADAVKVQIIFADRSYTKESESYKIFKAIEFTMDQWKRIAEHAQKRNIDIFATFTQPDDMSIADELEFPLLKISSSNVTNFPLLKAAARVKKPILMSTGLSYLSEVEEAVRCLEEEGCRDLALLHCTSLYPTSAPDVNLRALETLKKVFPYPIGFSEHTMGSHCSIAAVALGADIIEKHFTLDPAMEGPDHYFSMTPNELTDLVRSIREVEQALGDGRKVPRAGELPERKKLQRVLVASRDIAEGEVFSAENLTAKRSDHAGLETKWLETTCGRRAARSILKDQPITFDVIG